MKLPSGLRRERATDGELRLRASAEWLVPACAALRAEGARLVTVFAGDTPHAPRTVVLALRGELIAISAPAGAPTLGDAWPAARWAESELAGTLANPDDSRLEHHFGGLDVFSLPYGPVRSGIFEAIQFLIETGGEDLPRITTRPFFKHRGMQTRMNGLRPDVAVHVAERTAGIASVAYATAFSQAVERALGVEPSQAANAWRVLHAELERIACHLDVIAKEAETTALFVGNARFQILKEQALRLRALLSGSRFGRGTVIPGGVRVAGGFPLAQLKDAIDEFERDLRRDRELFLATASMTDRLIGSGRMAPELLAEYGAVGPLARGSGIATDARDERPYGAYRQLGVHVVTAHDADAMARVEVRFGELTESLRLVRECIAQLANDGGAPLVASVPSNADGAAFGWVEAPQGELVIAVALRGGVVEHVHIASPSLRNWALFDHAFAQDVLTDFAFIEHSFGLTPAGADR